MELPEPEFDDSPERLSEYSAAHLGCAELAVYEDDGDLDEFEPQFPGGIFHLDLETIPFHPDVVEIDAAIDQFVVIETIVTGVRRTVGTMSANAESIISILRESFKPLIEDICAKHSCNAPDEQYFVGLPAKEHDFTAPKAPAMEHYPPVRDVVHLDTTDYKNLDVSSDGRLSRQAFLQYGR